MTTAIEDTWPKSQDTPIIFLGEWCRLYSAKERWSRMNADVLPYHWDNRKKLYKDYQYLQGFYEQMLKTLSKELNEIHNIDHSLRYWRILIGPWLGYFLQMLFDRWSSIDQALNSYAIEETAILDYPPQSLISQGMEDFQDFFVSDEWNHFIYGQILQIKGNISFRHIKTDPFEIFRNRKKVRNSLKKSSIQLVGNFLSFFGSNDDFFFKSTYLPLLMQWELELKLKQIPKLWHSIPGPVTTPDQKKRTWVIESDKSSEFENFTKMLIPKILPTLYLEGYKSLVDLTDKLPWPKNPKVIWTSNAAHSDDVFKAWAAGKVESGSKLIIGQHGGHYGIGKWYFNEEHEISISDKYFSWGWKDSSLPKVTAVGQLKQTPPLSINHADQQRLLMVCLTMPRYSYHMYSTIMSSQYLNYLDDQFTFVNTLPNSIQKKLTVRLYKKDWGWEQKERWNEKHPEIKLDSGQKNIKHLIAQSRIYVSTYNATTFLESFSMNIPTVIFWNPNHWELRESAKPYFDSLKNVGIFHETPESAANHIVTIWDNVDSWWNDLLTKNAVSNFCEMYANTNTELLNRLSKEIRIISKGKL